MDYHRPVPVVLVQVAATLLRAAPQLASLPHVVDLIAAYLDASVRFTPPQAVAHGSAQLLDRVLARVMGDPAVDAAFRSHWLARALEVAIQQTRLGAVQQLHCAHPARLHVRSLHLALQHGNLEMIQWILEHRNDRRCCAPGLHNLCLKCLNAAVPSSIGSDPNVVDTVAWLVSVGADVASFQGWRRTVQVARWLDARGVLDTEYLLAGIIENGLPEQIATLRYLIDTGRSISGARLVSSLTRGASQHALEPLIDVVVGSRLCDALRDRFVWAATRVGGAKVLQWHATFMSEAQALSAAFYASHFCHVDTLVWLRRTRGIRPVDVPTRKPRNEQDLLALYEWMATCDLDGWCRDDAACAARNGYLSVVQWLHAHKHEQLTSRTMGTAAQEGHLDIVQWLHMNHTDGCSRDALTQASQRGHLAVVQWLSSHRTEGATNEALAGAAIGGHLDVLAWLHAHREDACGGCVLQHVLRDRQSVDAALGPLRWLCDHGARAASCVGRCLPDSPGDDDRLPSLAAVALFKGDLDVAQFLLAHDCAFRVHPVELVVRGGHLPAIQWLHAAAPESLSWDRVLAIALQCGDKPLAAWAETVV